MPAQEDMSFVQKLDIALQIAHALMFMHTGREQPVVHGDLKPGNVLLDRLADGWRCALTDFGTSGGCMKEVGRLLACGTEQVHAVGS